MNKRFHRAVALGSLLVVICALWLAVGARGADKSDATTPQRKRLYNVGERVNEIEPGVIIRKIKNPQPGAARFDVVPAPDLTRKVVLIEFWGTWCGTCLQKFPDLEAIHARYAKDGLVVLALTEDDKEKVETLYEKYGEKLAEFLIDHTFLMGTESPAVTDFYINARPQSYLIDKDRTVVHIVGRRFGGDGEDELDAAIRRELELD